MKKTKQGVPIEVAKNQLETLALAGEIADKIADLSIKTNISIRDLVGPDSMIQAMADRKAKEILDTSEKRIDHTLKVWSNL